MYYFILLFKQRLIKCHTQKWNSFAHDNEKLLYCKELKINLEFDSNFKIVEIKKHLPCLAKICCVSHKLEIEKGRHNHVPRTKQLCMKYNLGVIEDEYHVILICPKYFYLIL